MQDAGTPILGYAPSPKEGLTLEEEDGRAVVTFPVAPKWLYVLPIVVQLFGALMGVAMATLLLVVVVRLHVPISRSLVGVMAVLVSAAMASASVGVHSWFMYQRWGRVPRVLTADKTGLRFSSLGWLWIRERQWPVEEITGIELRVIKGHLNPWRTVAVLYVRRREGKARRFLLSSADPELPRRIARRFSEILARPLICRS